MSSATISSTAFSAARERALEREAAEQKAQEEQRAQREAERLQRIADNEAEASRLAAQQETVRIERAADRIRQGFFDAVIKHGDTRTKPWKAAAVDMAAAYAIALSSHEDVELPMIDPTMANVIHDKFTYGIVLSQQNSFNEVPDDYFVGQRQEWFPDLYARKLATFTGRRQ